MIIKILCRPGLLFVLFFVIGANLASPINERLAEIMDNKIKLTYGRVLWTGIHSLLSESDFISAEEYQFEPSTGSCYKLHEEHHVWDRAEKICKAEGGYLAVINTEEEANILRNMSSERTLRISKFDDLEAMFIGLRDWHKKGVWSTVLGDPLENVYDVWGLGQPDNLGNDQYCGSLLKNGTLADTWCHVKAMFMCERDPTKPRYRDPSVSSPADTYSNYLTEIKF